MPIDLAQVDWLYVVVLALFVFVATLSATCCRSTTAARPPCCRRCCSWRSLCPGPITRTASAAADRDRCRTGSQHGRAGAVAPAAPAAPQRPRNPVTDITPPRNPVTDVTPPAARAAARAPAR